MVHNNTLIRPLEHLSGAEIAKNAVDKARQILEESMGQVFEDIAYKYIKRMQTQGRIIYTKNRAMASKRSRNRHNSTRRGNKNSTCLRSKMEQTISYRSKTNSQKARRKTRTNTLC